MVYYYGRIRNRSDNPNRGLTQRIETPTYKSCKCEDIWCTITDESGKKIILALIYRSHQNTCFMEHIEGSLDYISNWNLPTILVGDFNYDLMKNSTTSRELTNIFNRQSMDQIVKQPTRITQDSSTLIDHIWVNDKRIVNNVQVGAGLSDHEMLKFKIGIEYKPSECKSYEYREINKYADKIVEELEKYDWELEMTGDDPEVKWQKLKGHILTALNKHAPIKNGA